MRRAELGLLFVILATVGVGAAGCGAISFDISQDIPATMVMGDPTASGVVGGDSQAPLSLDIQAETTQRHTGPASAAYLKDLSFTITMPQNGTFYFAQSVIIQLKPTDPNSTLPPAPIAQLSPIPTDQNTIHVTPIPGVNMLPYSQQGAVIDAVVFANFPREDTTYVGHVVVTVKI